MMYFSYSNACRLGCRIQWLGHNNSKHVTIWRNYQAFHTCVLCNSFIFSPRMRLTNVNLKEEKLLNPLWGARSSGIFSFSIFDEISGRCVQPCVMELKIVVPSFIVEISNIQIFNLIFLWIKLFTLGEHVWLKGSTISFSGENT